jgi:antitoxin (DNA-binding transcriptional repressor) of toxin-antitoxin stability system
VKIASMREAQHNFASLVLQVQRGETMEVHNRKILVARIIPIPNITDSLDVRVDWSGLPAQLWRIWKGKAPEGISTEVLLNEMRGER